MRALKPLLGTTEDGELTPKNATHPSFQQEHSLVPAKGRTRPGAVLGFSITPNPGPFSPDSVSSSN